VERGKGIAQEFQGSVGQVAGGNIINIHAAPAPAQPDPEVIRLVAELLTLAKANNLLEPVQRISQIQYGSTHFKGLKVWQLKKLIAVTQEVVVLVKPAEQAPPAEKKQAWWKFW
jgi:hypothetical protein